MTKLMTGTALAAALSAGTLLSVAAAGAAFAQNEFDHFHPEDTPAHSHDAPTPVAADASDDDHGHAHGDDADHAHGDDEHSHAAEAASDAADDHGHSHGVDDHAHPHETAPAASEAGDHGHPHGDGDHAHGDDDHGHAHEAEDEHDHDATDGGHAHSDDDHSHAHEAGGHANGDEAHGHARDGGGHDHGDGGHAHGDGDHGHAHDDGGHGHGGISETRFGEETQLFVEYPPLATGRESAFAAHFTRLRDWAPIARGEVEVVLSGGGAPDERFSVDGASTPGIFRPVVRPSHAAARMMTIALDGPQGADVFDLGEVQVFASGEEADAALPEEEEAHGEVSFLLETQWQVDFRVEEARARFVRTSVPAIATVRGQPGAEARMSAPARGLVQAPEEGFPELGDTIAAGQLVALVAPFLSSDRDIAGLEATRTRASAELDAARADRERLERLLRDGAVAERRVEEARTREQTAVATLEEAQRRLGEPGTTSAGVPVYAPIGGVVARLAAEPGQAVDEGALLIHVVDPSRLRIEAAVAEADLQRLSQPSGVSLDLAPGEAPLTLTAPQTSLVAVGAAIDPQTRTAPVLFDVSEPAAALRVGMSTPARVFTGGAIETLAIPSTAVIDADGVPVVYVLSNGEAFERRTIEIDARDGTYVEVAGGVDPGEWVVAEGAYLVHLAAAGPAEAGHGHAH